MQKYRFNFTLPLTIAFLIVFSILIKLGLWQLERADHKKNLNESYKLRQAEEVIDLNVHKSINSKESILWRRISLNGSFYKEKNLIVDNQIFKHEAGFNILTPFKIDGTGMTILINRGWHKNLINREQIPIIKNVDDIDQINGYAVKIPVPGINLGGSNIEIINASLARFQRINVDEINNFYQANFLPLISLNHCGDKRSLNPVSYTHLTLPTNREV